MKKIIILTLAFMMVFGMTGIGAASVDPGHSSDGASTELVKSSETGNDEIVIKAKWEMRRQIASSEPSGKKVGHDNSRWYYEDDNSANAPGAQFIPSGDENTYTQLKVCGVIAHPDLGEDPDDFSMSADVYYPTVMGILPDKQFCADRIATISMDWMSRNEGLRLVCGRTGADSSTGDDIYSSSEGIKNLDPTLPEFLDSTYEDFGDICHELEQQEALVFCGDIELSYEDPAGTYYVELNANGPDGEYSHLTNTFEYYELPSFKIDFDHINYGDVSLKEPTLSVDDNGDHVGGDIFMDTSDKPSIRGTGNTVLQLTVSQDDMGFGTMHDGSDKWNVKYRSRLSSLPQWSSGMYYYPNSTTVSGGPLGVETPTFYTLDRNLGLSEIQKLDFQVYVENFPSWHTESNYMGNVTISAVPVAFEICGQAPFVD